MIKEYSSFDTKKIGILSIMLWIFIFVLGQHFIILLFNNDEWIYHNYLFIEIKDFASNIGIILSIVLVSYYYSPNNKLKHLIKYLLKIILLLISFKVMFYIVIAYSHIYVQLFDLSDSVISFIFLISMFFKLAELHGKEIQFLSKLKIIAMSLIIWFLVSCPIYWATHTFITHDYFTYPSDYDHFKELELFIYMIGVLISVPLSIFIFSKYLNYDVLKKYSLTFLYNSLIFFAVVLIFFPLFTVYFHHISSVSNITVLLYLFGLLQIFNLFNRIWKKHWKNNYNKSKIFGE